MGIDICQLIRVMRHQRPVQMPVSWLFATPWIEYRQLHPSPSPIFCSRLTSIKSQWSSSYLILCYFLSHLNSSSIRVLPTSQLFMRRPKQWVLATASVLQKNPRANFVNGTADSLVVQGTLFSNKLQFKSINNNTYWQAAMLHCWI